MGLKGPFLAAAHRHMHVRRAQVEGTGCSEGCAYYWAELKEKIPHEHRQRLETYEASATLHRTTLSAKGSQSHNAYAGADLYYLHGRLPNIAR